MTTSCEEDNELRYAYSRRTTILNRLTKRKLKTLEVIRTTHEVIPECLTTHTDRIRRGQRLTNTTQHSTRLSEMSAT
jgi:hypothetical protein